MMLNIKEMILFKFVVMNDWAEWLWISTIINMYRLEWLPNWKMFCKVLKKYSQLSFSASEIGNVMSLHLFGWLCSDRCSGNGSPYEESLHARLVCPQEYTATYSRAIFFSNPMMQNKMCMWKLTNSLLTIAWVWNMICF